MKRLSAFSALFLTALVSVNCGLFNFRLEQRLIEIKARADQAVIQKKYDEAIKLYDSALSLAPNEPTCLSARASAYRMRGTDKYNSAIKLDAHQKQEGVESAKRDFLKAADDATAAVNIVKQNLYIAIVDTVTRDQHFLYSAATRSDCLNVVATVVNKDRAGEALDADHEYMAADTDVGRIRVTRLATGKMLLNTGNGDKALIEYKTVLDEEPENIEGLLGVGLALSQSGDAEKFQEAKKYLKRFVELAPDDHPMKADVINTLKYSEGR